MVDRFSSANSKLRQGGYGVPHIEDVRAHYYGSAFRHNAEQIDMLTIPASFSGTTVQQIINEMSTMLSYSGSGFISIGDIDGYSVGNYNVGTPATPLLSDALNAAIADPRLANGGIILLMAGTYIFTAVESTVDIPAGISIMGELAGTIIISEMVEVPMFKILQGDLRPPIGGDSGAGDLYLSAGSPLDYTKFFNLTLADNLYGSASVMTTVPMIQCEVSSNFICEEVRFIGRVNNGVVLNRLKTLRAIGYTAGGGTSTCLTIRHCYFDAMQTAIGFSPNNGDIDSLTIDKCRARTFGTESAPAGSTHADNCFVSMSLCNALITNNYHVGVSSSSPTVSAFAVLTSGIASTTTKITLVGNTGGPSIVAREQTLFVDSVPLTYVNTVRSGNAWGDNLNNEWFIVVGSGDPVSAYPPGDIVGTSALDIVFATGHLYPTTVILNPGTYTVTAGSASRLKLIGNKIGGNYPVINLNIASAATEAYAGNRYLDVGPVIKSISFTSTANYHSILPSYSSEYQVEVDDCKFTNIAVIVPPITAVVGQKIFINVVNCAFSQDDTFDDNIDILLPPAGTVLVDKCRFSGNGYIGGIGTVTGTYTHTAQSTPTFEIRQCVMNLYGGVADRIANHSPISVTASDYTYNRYFWINESNATVLVDDCKMLTATALSPITNAINSILVSPPGAPATFTSFIYFYARNIIITNSTFNGPVQTFDFNNVGISNLALPTLFMEPAQLFRFVNSRIINGALPLQLSGTNLFSAYTWRGNCEIVGSEFNSNSSTVTQTLIDIDFAAPALTLATYTVPQVIMSNNNFTQRCTASPAEVWHINDSTYAASGVVQVFSPAMDIYFNNNRMYANIKGMPAGFNTFTVNCGVYLNNYSFGTGTENTDKPRAIFVSDNNIETENLLSTGSLTDYDHCMHIKSNIIQVHNNRFNQYNSIGADGSNKIGCLMLDNLQSTSTAYSEAIVSENIFSRRNPSTGALTSLDGGYAVITAASGAGTFIDNSFDSERCAAAAPTTLVADDTFTWFVKRNKNQTETISLRGYNGQLGLMKVTEDGYTVAGKPFNTTNSNIYFIDSSSDTIFFDNRDSELQTGCWQICMADVLPEGVNVISASCVVDVSANPTGSSIAKLAISSGGSEDFDIENPLTTLGATLSVTSSTTRRVLANTTTPSIYLTYTCNDVEVGGTNIIFSAQPISVTYRW